MHMAQGSRRCSLDTRYWMLVIGYSLLVSGSWLLIFRSLKVISLLSMPKKLAKDIFTLKKDGAKRHQQIFNFQFSIFNSGLSGLGLG
jgi:hypothetical protein